jgi:Ni,Fe-hydrogenase III large subunit
MALESLSGTRPSERALLLRALLLERERIVNHLGDLGYLGNDCSLAFGFAQFWRVKEDMLRTNARLFGHRYLMDRIVPGGVDCDIDAAAANALNEEALRLKDELRRPALDLLQPRRPAGSLRDDRSIAARHRRATRRRRACCACERPRDGCRVYPGFAPYERLEPKLVSHRNGDVAARIVVRFEEAFESLRLQRVILRSLVDGALRVPLGAVRERAFGIGWVEGWRGEVLIALEAGADGCIRRCHAHDRRGRTGRRSSMR